MFRKALQTVGLVAPKTPDPRYRGLHLRAATLNVDLRTVEAVVATEAQALSYNLRTGQLVLEVYLADGFQRPPSGQVCLLDTHQRGSTDHMRGSVRSFRVMDENVLGRLHFGSTTMAMDDWLNVRDGHLTDVSGGFRPMASTLIRAGNTATVKGKSYTAPSDRDLYIHTKWALAEVSLTCIGADEDAKIQRAEVADAPNQHRASNAATVTRSEAELYRREVIAVENLRCKRIRDLDPLGLHPVIIREHMADPAKTEGQAARAILERERALRCVS